MAKKKKDVREIKTLDFVNKLESLQLGLDNKEFLAQSSSFIFKDGKIITFNDDIYASVDYDLGFEGAVEAEPLLKFIKKIDKNAIINVWKEKSELRISGKNFDTGIKIKEKINLPIDEVTLPDKENFIDVDRDFAELLHLACLTAKRDTGELTRIHFIHIENDIIESCDNDRITVCYLDSDTGIDILSPAKSLMEISKEYIEKMCVDDSWIHFLTGDDTMLSARLVDDDYVDLREFLPDGNSEIIDIDLPDELSKVLNRASIFASSDENEKLIKISFEKNLLKIHSMNETGWDNEKIEIDYSGPELEFSINISLLKYILEMTDEVHIVDQSMFMFKYIDQEMIKSLHLVRLETEDGEEDE